MPLEALTAAQQELYDWLAEFIADNRHSPSIRQMMQGMGLRSRRRSKAACATCSRRAGSPGKRAKPAPCSCWVMPPNPSASPCSGLWPLAA